MADAVEAHVAEVKKGVNSASIRKTADRMIALKSKLFGQTNAGSALVLVEADAKSPVEAEELSGKEGRLLTRLHVYKERDRKFAKQVRDHYRHANGGVLRCEACDSEPAKLYGPPGESSMEAHHKIPIEELQPRQRDAGAGHGNGLCKLPSSYPLAEAMPDRGRGPQAFGHGSLSMN